MALPSNKTGFSFNHADQPDDLGTAYQGDFQAIQELFDSRAEELRVLVNEILTTMRSITTSDSGAHNIASQQIGDLSSSNVFGILSELYNLCAFSEGSTSTPYVTWYREYENGIVEMVLKTGSLDTDNAGTDCFLSDPVAITFPVALAEEPDYISIISEPTTGDWLGAKITAKSATAITLAGVGLNNTTAGELTISIRGIKV